MEKSFFLMMKPKLFCQIFFVSFFAAGSLASAQDAARRGIDNPQEPWVFRTVLDARPRVLVAAFDDSLWAAWDTQRCRLFRIWKPGDQGVKLQGAVFDGAHGPQPVSDGTRLHEEAAEPAWYARDKDQAVPALVRYRGHRTGAPGELGLAYQVILPNGRTAVSVEETPSFVSGSGSSLSRKFTIQGLPPGGQIALQLSGDASIWRSQGTAGGLRDRGNNLYLVIDKNGEVTLIGSWGNP